MSAQLPEQVATRGRRHQAAPETPRKRGDGAAINDLVRQLRDELSLAIAPRDLFYSPSQHNSQADILYNRIKSLYWQEQDALYATIEECRSDLAGHLSTLSPERRTDFVYQRLSDPTWFAANRVHQPLHRGTSSFPTRIPSDTGPAHRSLMRIDSRAETPSPSTSASPLARKTMAREADDSQTTAEDNFSSGESFAADIPTADTSFTSSANYGPSISDSQLEYLSAVSRSKSAEGVITGSIAHTSNLGQSATKRRGSDGSNGLHESLTKKVRQEPRHEPEAPESKHSPDEKDNVKQRHHQITALAVGGDMFEHPYVNDSTKSWAVSMERARIQYLANLTNEQVSSITTYDSARTVLTKYKETPSHSSIWNLPNTACVSAGDTKLILSATAKFNAKNDASPLFQITWNPIRKETKSTHLERHFGFDRILTITFPSMTRDLPKHLQGQKGELSSAFMDKILKPIHFMGRVWRVFFSKEHEKKGFKKKVIDNSKDRDFFFFAVSGHGIDTSISYFDFMNWMIPFKENAAQSAYKLFARIPLYLSRTFPSIQFTWEQIRFVKDKHATGAPEDITFEDSAFKYARRKRFKKDEVMTDGCARISVGALKEHSRITGMPYCHGAIQARINGHKGLWIPSAPENTQDLDHLAIWIELRPSQEKLKIRDEDRDDSLCEKDRWSFNVVKQTRPHRCSVLHRDFLQLLEDRHVPRDALLAMIKERIEFPVEEWSEALRDPARWVVLRDKYFWSGSTQQDLMCGLPHKDADKTKVLMDKAGFVPSECLPLAKSMQRMQESFFQQLRSRLSFECTESTYLPGVPDPVGVLEPGEVHLSLTQPFVDEATGEICDTGTFKDKDVLVTRHPSGLRSSDMQKVRCVCHPSLAHLKDVVVMSTQGQVPLAAKLQGGDYDGDEFWVCADSRLTGPFQNVPVLEQLGLSDLGIRHETERLLDIVHGRQLKTDHDVESWLRVTIPFACQEQQLGAITNYLNELAYHRSLSDPGVCLLADLHGLIIDTNKNGYKFDYQDFITLCRNNKGLGLDLSRREKPAYLENLARTTCESNRIGIEEGRLRSIVAPNGKTPSGKILDVVVFQIVNSNIYNHLKETHETFFEPAQRAACDNDLHWILQNCPVTLTGSERNRLDVSLNSAYAKWGFVNNSRRTTSRTSDDHAKAWQDCINAYNAITAPSGPDERLWQMKHSPIAPTLWDCYKVGVLASKQHYLSKKTFMFRVATDTVCYLKSLSARGKAVIERADETKKARKPKDWAAIGNFSDLVVQGHNGNENGDDNDDDEDDNESMFGFDGGTFDDFA